MEMRLAKYRCMGCVSLEEINSKLVCVKSNCPIEDIDDCTTVPYCSIKQRALNLGRSRENENRRRR